MPIEALYTEYFSSDEETSVSTAGSQIIQDIIGRYQDSPTDMMPQMHLIISLVSLIPKWLFRDE